MRGNSGGLFRGDQRGVLGFIGLRGSKGNKKGFLVLGLRALGFEV